MGMSRGAGVCKALDLTSLHRGGLRSVRPGIELVMEKRPSNPKSKERQKEEAEARRKLSRPPKDKTGVTIGPTDRSGPDIVLG